MDLDKMLNEMTTEMGDYRQVDNSIDAEEGQESKSIRMGTAVSKGFIESFVGSLPDKVGKDIKTRLGGSMGKRLTVGEFISTLGEIMKAGNMTRMVMLKDISFGGGSEFESMSGLPESTDLVIKQVKNILGRDGNVYMKDGKYYMTYKGRTDVYGDAENLLKAAVGLQTKR